MIYGRRYGSDKSTYLSQPMASTSYRIFYRNEYLFHGDPISGIFDLQSSLCVALSFGLLALSAWFYAAKEREKLALGQIVFHYTAHIFGQEIPFEGSLTRKGSKIALLAFVVFSLFVRLFYLSVCITKMTGKTKTSAVDSLEDLLVQKERKLLEFDVLSNYQNSIEAYGQIKSRLVDLNT